MAHRCCDHARRYSILQEVDICEIKIAQLIGLCGTAMPNIRPGHETEVEDYLRSLIGETRNWHSHSGGANEASKENQQIRLRMG
jgi:hypothetical protein